MDPLSYPMFYPGRAAAYGGDYLHNPVERPSPLTGHFLSLLASIPGAVPGVDQMAQGLDPLTVADGAQGGQPPPPEGGSLLLKQLASLGTLPQRRAFAQQLTQGVPVDYSHGKGTPLLLAGLANLVASGIGGYQQGKLDKEQTAGRSALMGLLDGADPAAQRKAGMAAMLSGDEVAGKLAPMLLGAPQQALQMEQERQALETGKLTQAHLRQQMEGEGPQAALGGQTPKIFEALTKRRTADQQAENWEHFANPVTGEAWLINKRTGQAKPMSAGGGSGGAVPNPTLDKRLPAFQEKFAKDMDPNAFRAGVLKGNQERANAAERLLQLAVDPLTGEAADLNPQQMTELSTSLASLLSGGGGGSEGQRHELTPYTKGRKFAEIMQWLTDAPHGADQKKFVQLMIDTAKREKGVVEKQIQGAQAQRLANHLQYLSMFPDQAKAQIQSYGLDPDAVDFKTGKYTPKTDTKKPDQPVRKKYNPATGTLE